jgi:hypothetical protein
MPVVRRAQLHEVANGIAVQGKGLGGQHECWRRECGKR